MIHVSLFKSPQCLPQIHSSGRPPEPFINSILRMFPSIWGIQGFCEFCSATPRNTLRQTTLTKSRQHRMSYEPVTKDTFLRSKKAGLSAAENGVLRCVFPKVDVRSVLKMVTNKTTSGQRYPAHGHTVKWRWINNWKKRRLNITCFMPCHSDKFDWKMDWNDVDCWNKTK